MVITYDTRYASGPETVKNYGTAELRKEFLIDNLMEVGKITLTYSHFDRYIAGSVVPDKPLRLETVDPLKAQYFLERRELGIINVGDPGSVEVDGTSYKLDHKDALYIGQGAKDVIFNSDNAQNK